MGALSPTNSMTQHLHPDARQVVAQAEEKPPAARTSAGSSTTTAPPGPAHPEPRGTGPLSPQEAAAKAQKAFSTLQEERLKLAGKDQSKVSMDEKSFVRQLEDSAKKAADDSVKAQIAELRYQSLAKPGTSPNFSALEKKVSDALRLQRQAGGTPREIAEIADDWRSAKLHELAKATHQLSVKIEQLANTKGSVPPDLERAIRDTIAEARNAATGAEDAAEESVRGWTFATAFARRNSPEAEACDKRRTQALRVQQDVKKDVNELKSLVKQLEGLLAQANLAPNAAKQAQLQFHKETLALIEKAEKLREQLARDSVARTAQDNLREANVEADAANRELERSEHQADERKQALREQQQAQAKSDKDEETARKHAEIAKQAGATLPTFE
jgi:hypothetical protein